MRIKLYSLLNNSYTEVLTAVDTHWLLLWCC